MLRAFTLNLDDRLMQAAKARALQERTSVSEIVRRLLSSYVGVAVEQPATVDATKITEVLVRYSKSEIRRGEAMRAVGLDIADLDQFNALMVEFGIGWPEQDAARVAEQAEIVAGIVARESEAAR
jgi:hypothetical protein